MSEGYSDPQTIDNGRHKLRILVCNYSDVLAKSKFDIKKVRLETQWVVLTSYLLVSLRLYHTSPAHEEEINNQRQNLLAID